MEETIDEVVGKLLNRTLIPLAIFLQEVIAKERYILPPFAQRRDFELDERFSRKYKSLRNSPLSTAS